MLNGLGFIDVLSLKSVNYYSDNAPTLASRYNSLNPESLHASWSRFIPEQPGIALDIGAASGRDANWLAEKGWDVIAVEPCKEFRELAKPSSHANVIWQDDELPGLKSLRAAGHRFNLILLSAVWMHVLPGKRERAFRIISELLAPGGLLVFTLRHGNDEQENTDRGFHPVSSGELELFARHLALAQVPCKGSEDHLARSNVRWETLVFKLPDDGTGSLPLLRHVIVNDDKSATYKLGLLRTLIRIAEGAPGMVTRPNDDTVEVPFGLVGLYWIKLYMPLVLKHGLIQSPSHKPLEKKGLGFAKEHFYQLARLSPFDLRIGAMFDAEHARPVVCAIRDVCKNIQDMPANYITYPGRSDQVFDCERQTVRSQNGKPWRIDKQTLADFGVFVIPAAVWQCLGQYACWLEPVIINEWARLMQGYDVKNNDYKFGAPQWAIAGRHIADQGPESRKDYCEALQWDEGRHDTGPVRERVQELRQDGESVYCVWTNARLRERFEVDHCFPWSRWYNNDLWNLMPASKKANEKKREKLPSAPLLHHSRSRITDWWDAAYLDGRMREQFLLEAASTLPLVDDGTTDLTAIFEAVMHQRAKLKANQQLAEWTGLNHL